MEVQSRKLTYFGHLIRTAFCWLEGQDSMPPPLNTPYHIMKCPSSAVSDNSFSINQSINLFVQKYNTLNTFGRPLKTSFRTTRNTFRCCCGVSANSGAVCKCSDRLSYEADATIMLHIEHDIHAVPVCRHIQSRDSKR